MKLLFLHSVELVSEKSGMIFQNINNSEVLSGEEKGLDVVKTLTEKKEQEKKLNQLETNIKLNEARKETEKKYAEDTEVAETEKKVLLNKISDKIKEDISPEKAKNMTLSVYTEKVNTISGRFQAEIDDYNEKYVKLLPDSYVDNLKIGGVVGAVVYGSTADTPRESLKKAAAWGAGAALIAHPAIAGGLAKGLKFVGKEAIAPGFVGATNLVMELIDNPKRLMEAVKNSDYKGKSFGETKIGNLLKGSSSSEEFGKQLAEGQQNVLALEKQGLAVKDPDLKQVINVIRLTRQEEKTGKSISLDKSKFIPVVSKFLSGMESHVMSDKEMKAARFKIWNKEAAPSTTRKVLANNVTEDIRAFCEKHGLMGEIVKEQQKQEVELSKKGLKPEILDIAKTFIDTNAKEGEQGFDLSDKKHGVRRFMAMGAGGSAFALYIISFLTVNSFMKAKNLFRPSTYSSAVDKIKEAPSKWGSAAWEGMKKTFRKSPVRSLSKISKKNKWTTKEQRKLLSKLSKEDKKSVGKRLDNWSDNQDKVYKDKLASATKNLRGKEKREAAKKVKQEVEMTKDQFWSMFDGVSPDVKAKLDTK